MKDNPPLEQFKRDNGFEEAVFDHVRPSDRKIEKLIKKHEARKAKGEDPDKPSFVDTPIRTITKEERKKKEIEKKEKLERRLRVVPQYFDSLIGKITEKNNRYKQAVALLENKDINELGKYLQLLKLGIDSYITHGSDATDKQGMKKLTMQGDLDSYFAHFVLRRVLGSWTEGKYGKYSRFPEKMYVKKGDTSDKIGTAKKIFLISDTGNKNEFGVEMVGDTIVMTADHHAWGEKIAPTSVTDMHYLLLKQAGEIDRLPREDQIALQRLAKFSVAEDNYAFTLTPRKLLHDYPNSLHGIFRGLNEDQVYDLLKTKQYDEPFTEEDLEQTVLTKNGTQQKLRLVVEAQKKRVKNMLTTFLDERNEGGMVESFDSPEFGRVALVTIPKDSKDGLKGVNIVTKALGYDVVVVINQKDDNVFVSTQNKPIDVIYERMHQYERVGKTDADPETIAFPRGTMIVQNGGRQITKEKMLDILNLDRVKKLELPTSMDELSKEEIEQTTTQKALLFKEQVDSVILMHDVDSTLALSERFFDEYLKIEKNRGWEKLQSLLLVQIERLRLHLDLEQKRQESGRIERDIEIVQTEISDIDKELAELETALLGFQTSEEEEFVVPETEEKESPLSDMKAKKADIEIRRQEEYGYDRVEYWTDKQIKDLINRINSHPNLRTPLKLTREILLKIDKAGSGREVAEILGLTISGSYQVHTIPDIIEDEMRVVMDYYPTLKEIDAKYDTELAALENKFGTTAAPEIERINKERQAELLLYGAKIEPEARTGVQYLAGLTKDRFSRISDNAENSFFRMYDINADTAKFEFFGDDAQALAQRVPASEGVFDVEGGSITEAEFINTAHPGELKREGDSWVVTKKVRVVLGGAKVKDRINKRYDEKIAALENQSSETTTTNKVEKTKKEWLDEAVQILATYEDASYGEWGTTSAYPEISSLLDILDKSTKIPQAIKEEISSELINVSKKETAIETLREYKREDFPEFQSNTRTPETKKLLDYLARVLDVPPYDGDISSGTYISWLNEHATASTNDTSARQGLTTIKLSLNAPRQVFDLIARYEAELNASEHQDTSTLSERKTILNSLRGALTMKDKKLREALLLAMHWGAEDIDALGGPKKALEKVMRDLRITKEELQ